jgi:hypothetical protein
MKQQDSFGATPFLPPPPPSKAMRQQRSSSEALEQEFNSRQGDVDNFGHEAFPPASGFGNHLSSATKGHTVSSGQSLTFRCLNTNSNFSFRFKSGWI